MNLINKYEKCWILSFSSIGRWKLELVYCPPNYEIQPHTHNQQDIKLIFLFGHNIRFFRQRPNGKLISFLARIRHIGKVFTIRANDIHYFNVSRWPLLFLNIERWKTKPSSAAIDLQLTNSTKEKDYARKT